MLFKIYKIPKPALTINPPNKAPKPKPSSRYNLVKTTDEAQLGINPTIIDNKGAKYFADDKNDNNLSSVTK